MIKKIIIPVVCVAIVVLSIIGYLFLRQKTVSSKTDIYSSVPGEPCVILQINSIKDFQESLLYNNNYWLNLTILDPIRTTHELIMVLDSIKDTDNDIATLIDRSALIAIYPTENGGYQKIMTAQISASEYDKAIRILNGRFKMPAHTEYYSEFLLSSDSDSLIAQAKECINKGISPILEDKMFCKARMSAGNKQEANIFINAGRCQNLIGQYILPERKRLFELIQQFDSWCGYDVDFSEDKIEINGFAYYDKTDGMVAAFSGQNTDHNTLSAAMPYNTFFFRHFAISNLDDYIHRFNVSNDNESEDYDYEEVTTENILETSSGESPSTFLQEFFNGEIVVGYSPLEEFIIIKLTNTQEAISVLRRIALELNPNCITRKNGLEIIHIGKNGFAESVLGPYFHLSDEYICIAGGNMIITPTEHFTTYIATRNQQTQTLQCSPVFRSADRTLLSTSNRSVYFDIPYITRNAEKFFIPKYAKKIKQHKQLWANFDCIGMQGENEGISHDYQHIFIQYSGIRGEFVAEKQPSEKIEEPEPTITEKPAIADSKTQVGTETETMPTANIAPDLTSEKIDLKQGKHAKLFSIKLDAPAAIKPQIFTNHNTGENEIFIQDTNNQIYLISASGKILWKTSIKEAIIGGIKSVDILNNKKLQIAFVTEHKLYVIDRNGKVVNGYPIELKGGVCTPLAVFDYNNNKDYRFAYGTADNKIHIVKKDGTPLNEWKNVSTKSNIIGDINHFRVSGKDFIVFSDADKSYFLDRKANHRLTCGASLVRAKNSGTYTDMTGMKMVMSLSNGKICFINTNDKTVSTQLKKYGDSHYFNKTKSHYIYSWDKGVDVYDADLNLIFTDDVNGGNIETSETSFVIYSSNNKTAYIYTQSSEGFTKNNITANSGLITLSALKPATSLAVIICNSNTIDTYSVK